MLLELHNIHGANTVEETTVKIVELRVRIGRADSVFGIQIQNMQKMSALLPVIDSIVKQHTVPMTSSDFNSFCIRVTSFTTNSCIELEFTTKPSANVINEKHSLHSENKERRDQERWISGSARR